MAKNNGMPSGEIPIVLNLTINKDGTINSLDQIDKKVQKITDDIDKIGKDVKEVDVDVKVNDKDLKDFEKRLARIQKSSRNVVDVKDFLTLSKSLGQSAKYAKKIRQDLSEITVKADGRLYKGYEDLMQLQEKGWTRIGKLMSQVVPESNLEKVKKSIVDVTSLTYKLQKAINNNESVDVIDNLVKKVTAVRNEMMQLGAGIRDNKQIITAMADACRQLDTVMSGMTAMSTTPAIATTQNIQATKQQINTLNKLRTEMEKTSRAWHDYTNEIHNLNAEQKKLEERYPESVQYLKSIDELRQKARDIGIDNLPATSKKTQHKQNAKTIADKLNRLQNSNAIDFGFSTLDFHNVRAYSNAAAKSKDYSIDELNELMDKAMAELRQMHQKTLDSQEEWLHKNDDDGRKVAGVQALRDYQERRKQASIEYNTLGDKKDVAWNAYQEFVGSLKSLGIDVDTLEKQIQESIEETTAKKNNKKSKLVKFSSMDEYDKAIGDGNGDKFRNQAVLIEQVAEFGKQVMLDIITDCKTAETALRRMFAAIDFNQYPALKDWQESMSESMSSGVLTNKETYNGMYTGAWSYGIEQPDEGVWYAYLNYLDVAKDKEQAYSDYLQKEFQLRDEGLNQERILLTEINRAYDSIYQLKKQDIGGDSRLQTYEKELDSLTQQKTIMEFILDAQKQLNDIKGKYKTNEKPMHIGVEKVTPRSLENIQLRIDGVNEQIKYEQNRISQETAQALQQETTNRQNNIDTVKQETQAIQENTQAKQKQTKVSNARNNIDTSNSAQIQKAIDDAQFRIKNAQDWIDQLSVYFDATRYESANKREATQKLKTANLALANYRKDPEKYSYLQYAQERFEIDAAQSYKAAKAKGVAQSVLSKYQRVGIDDEDLLKTNLQTLQSTMEFYLKSLLSAQNELSQLKQTLSNTTVQQTEDIKQETQAIQENTQAVEQQANTVAKAETKKKESRHKKKNTDTAIDGQLSLFDTGTESVVEQTAQKVVETKQEQTQATIAATQATEQQAATEQKVLDTVKQVSSAINNVASDEISIQQIIENNIQKAINLLSGAENNVGRIFNFSNIVDSEDLISRAQAMVDQIVKQANLTLQNISVNGNVINTKLFDEQLQTTIKQVYVLKAATEEAEASMQLLPNSTYSINVKALRKAQSEIPDMRDIANARIGAISENAKKAKVDLTELKQLADSISSKEDNTHFNNQFKVIKDKIQEYTTKAQSDRSLNALTAMVNAMNNAQTEVDTLQFDLNKLGNSVDTSKAQAEINKMTEAIQRFKTAANSDQQATAYQDYTTSRSAYKAEFKYQKALKAANKKQSDDAAKVAQEETSQINTPIQQSYNELLSTIQKINTLNERIAKYQAKNTGSGMFTNLIEGMKFDRDVLQEQLDSISQSFEKFYTDGFVSGSKYISLPTGDFIGENYNGVLSFLNDVKTQSVLSEKEIDNLVNSFSKMSEFKVSSQDNMASMFKSFADTNANLAKTPNIGKEQLATLQAMRNEIAEVGKMSVGEDGKLQLGITWDDTAIGRLKELIAQYEQYGNTVAKVANQENQYFRQKQKYMSGFSIQDINKNNVSASNTVSEIRTTLEQTAKEFAQNSNMGQTFITGFTQAANGISKLNFSAFDTGTQSLRNFELEMGKVTDNVTIAETTMSNSFAKIQAAQKQLDSASTLLGGLKNMGIDTSADTASKQVSRLVGLMSELRTAMNPADGNIDNNAITNISKQLDAAIKETNKGYNQLINMNNKVADSLASPQGSVDLKGNVYSQAVDQINRYAESVPNATVQIGRYNAEAGKIPFTINQANRSVQQYEMQISSLSGQMQIQQTGMKQMGSTISQTSNAYNQFKTVMGGVIQQLSRAVIGYNAFFKAVSMVKTGIGYVKDIDWAMTELKKVTDETAATYDSFLTKSYSSAKDVGGTISDFITSTSDFARLGYDLNQSDSLAKTAIVYKNVADGLNNIDDATSSIVSTMAAFNVQAEDSMSIADKFNEVKFIASLYGNIYETRWLYREKPRDGQSRGKI